MSGSDEEILMCEYVQRFKGKIFWPLRYSGFCRFDINNERVVPKTMKSIIINLCLICSVTYGAMLILNSSSEFDIQLPETLAVLHFTIYVDLRFLNLSFATRYSGSDLVESCIKVDAFLGTKETLFMRDIQIKFYTAICIAVGFVQVIVNIYLYHVFDVSMKIHVIGSSYFFWIFFTYHDYIYFISVCIFLALRVRYLNIALMKVVKINPNYVPQQYLFHKLLWKDNFDNLVTFDARAGNKEFAAAYRMLLNLLQDVGHVNRFSVLLGIATIVVGSFVATQTLLMYAKTAEVDNIRAGAIIGWVVMSWYFILFCTLTTDMFYKELEFTNLICAYTQLKPTNSHEILKLTKKILNTLEDCEKRISIYGIVYFDTGLILRLAASTFVYITVQLQMAFPTSGDIKFVNNSSRVPES